jgi:hypothetical protein
MKPEDRRFSADEVKYGPEAAARIQELEAEVAKLHDKVMIGIQRYRKMTDAFESAHHSIQEAYEEAEAL